MLAQPVNVYNFEVAGDHTYFVDQGGEPVWVHNDCSLGAFGDIPFEGQAKDFFGLLRGYERQFTIAVADFSDGITRVAISSLSEVPELVAEEAERLGIKLVEGICVRPCGGKTFNLGWRGRLG